MKKHFLWIATLAMGLYACSDDAVTTGEELTGELPSQETEAVTPLSHVSLAAFSGNQTRVSYGVASRAAEVQPGSLRLIAEVENPSIKQNGVAGFVKEEGGRYLSATCVYYDDRNDTYYATYHMQGNNYGTELVTDVAGIIESFRINAAGEVELGSVYRTNDNTQLDFDFNHLYFDNQEKHNGVRTSITEDRIIAVGHLVKPTSTGKKDTQAMIAKVNLDGEPSIDYKVVYTGEKILDENGKSLGKEDAQDVNAVVRSYDTYYLATRKGVALLNGTNDSLFEPRLDWAGNNYFLKSEGSVKHIAKDGGYNPFTILYLTEDFPQGFDYDTSISAKMTKVDVSNNGLTGQAWIGNSRVNLMYVEGKDINNIRDYSDWPSFNVDFDRPVAPVDGKNVLFLPPGQESQYYAALGKAGLYYKNGNTGGMHGLSDQGRLDFGNRPVNGVFVDDGTGSEHHNGFIYVANGSKLTIFNRYRLDEVASFNLPESEIGSANYVIARTDTEYNEFGTLDRIITVAYGQAGVKVFRFTPKNTY